MPEPAFLVLEDILFIHQQEIQISGGEPNIHNQEGIKACIDSPKASFGGDYPVFTYSKFLSNYYILLTCIP